MGCPTLCILGENLTFSIQAATTPTGDVNYAVYEDTTTTEILSGTMTKDFDSKTGFCLKQIACTTANGFERYKSYTIRITGTVAGVSLARDYTFLCLGVEDTPQATTGALTTTAKFKSYANITTTDDDTLIGYLISRATSAIESYCNRILRSSSYRERYNGDGETILLLNQYPVTAISLLGTSIEDALKITNTSSDAWNARVSVSSTTMSLTIDGGANDGTDTLTLSSYTLATLATAIAALGKGWAAEVTVSDFGIYDADEILLCSSLQCLDQYVYVQVPNEFEYDFLIQGGLASPYRRNNGTVFLSNGFPQGTQNITIRYTAGYSTTPADLEQICIDLVNTYYRGRETDSTIKSEKLGDHSITYAEGGGGGARDIPSHLAKRLAPYKRWRMAI